MSRERAARSSRIPQIAFCREKARLAARFLDAVRELTAIQQRQTQAVIDGDPDFARFDEALHLAHENKDAAKYAWIAHVEQHGCHEGELIDDTIKS